MDIMIQVGQWVYGYSKGIYRVERIIERYVDESVDPAARQGLSVGQKFPSPLVVLKRCTDDSYSKSFSYEVCDASLCRNLSFFSTWRLERVLRKNPTLLSEFNDYAIPKIESRYGLWLCMPEGAESLFTPLLEFMQQGRTFVEVRQFMTDIGLWKYHRTPIDATLYLTNYDFEIDEQRRQIYRSAELVRT